MAEAPVDLKQPRPKRNRRPTQKVHDNEKQQHEKKKLKTLKPPSIEDLDDDFLNLIGRLRVSRWSVKHDRFRGLLYKSRLPDEFTLSTPW